MTVDDSTLKSLSPVKVWNEFLDNEKFREERERLIPSKLETGTREDVLLVTGENASGKSVAFLILNNLVRHFGKEDKIDVLVMDIGMSRRTRSGIERALIFGDEGRDSTGNISVRVMQTASRIPAALTDITISCLMNQTSALEKGTITPSGNSCMILQSLCRKNVLA